MSLVLRVDRSLLISGLSYPSTKFLTGRMRMIRDFVTHQFLTLALSLAHIGGPATFAIAQESQVYKPL